MLISLPSKFLYVMDLSLNFIDFFFGTHVRIKYKFLLRLIKSLLSNNQRIFFSL